MEVQAVNPFAMMIDPQSVLQAVERSERLQRLQRRVCRPLDEPVDYMDGLLDMKDFDRLVHTKPVVAGLMPLGGIHID
ncbi:hypothetical protein LepocDRAFT_00001370 [Leptothrix ochracea L12]|uniref:Uncharacterized protein n=1 Tax=Leptothrix ochracea L12 TaxID=735332 RepID=I4Z5B7_9BURK|nr:hypothetical protein [Leptothrix ochracea]EIM31409.1 hypothetical protein LepocDRAFT_00001370 [Leptothrix ochracea L12]